LKTSLQTPYNERSSLSELTSSSAPIPSSTSTRSYSQEGNSPSITRSPSTEHCVAAATSAGLVGGIVAGACVAVATVLVVLYVGCRKTKTWKPSQGCNYNCSVHFLFLCLFVVYLRSVNL
jgi:hypothetical protein